MCNLPGHFFLEDAVRLSQHAEEFRGIVHGSAQVTDFHLILLAGRADLTFVTFDRGAAALAEQLHVPVALLTNS
jgi:predicted nucleic acid-binding protein